MIRIHNLHKSFGKNQVLKGVSLEFRPGAITAVLGPNGSGKTTLLKSILGMVIPDKGSVEMDGKDTKGKWKYRDQIDYLPQIARFPENLKVAELLRMVTDLRDRPADSTRLLKLFGLESFLDTRLGNLSGGTRQKVNIVLAFMYDSPVVMMDEPTAGLDPVALIKLKDLILEERTKGKTILITTHIMSLVDELADEVVFLLEGKIHFQGSLDLLREKYGEDNLERAIARILETQNNEVETANLKT
jgi:Cu-processing system ATP-binding protein